jgi:hypothetical protein
MLNSFQHLFFGLLQTPNPRMEALRGKPAKQLGG